MAESSFIKAFNQGHVPFQRSKGEDFTIADTTTTITAIEIADLDKKTITALGGKYTDNHVQIEAFKADIDSNGIKEGTKIVVRGRRLRIDSMVDGGDNRYSIIAGPAGVKL